MSMKCRLGQVAKWQSGKVALCLGNTATAIVGLYQSVTDFNCQRCCENFLHVGFCLSRLEIESLEITLHPLWYLITHSVEQK